MLNQDTQPKGEVPSNGIRLLGIEEAKGYVETRELYNFSGELFDPEVNMLKSTDKLLVVPAELLLGNQSIETTNDALALISQAQSAEDAERWLQEMVKNEPLVNAEVARIPGMDRLTPDTRKFIGRQLLTRDEILSLPKAITWAENAYSKLGRENPLNDNRFISRLKQMREDLSQVDDPDKLKGRVGYSDSHLIIQTSKDVFSGKRKFESAITLYEGVRPRFGLSTWADMVVYAMAGIQSEGRFSGLDENDDFKAGLQNQSWQTLKDPVMRLVASRGTDVGALEVGTLKYGEIQLGEALDAAIGKASDRSSSEGYVSPKARLIAVKEAILAWDELVTGERFQQVVDEVGGPVVDQSKALAVQANELVVEHPESAIIVMTEVSELLREEVLPGLSQVDVNEVLMSVNQGGESDKTIAFIKQLLDTSEAGEVGFKGQMKVLNAAAVNALGKYPEAARKVIDKGVPIAERLLRLEAVGCDLEEGELVKLIDSHEGDDKWNLILKKMRLWEAALHTDRMNQSELLRDNDELKKMADEVRPQLQTLRNWLDAVSRYRNRPGAL